MDRYLKHKTQRKPINDLHIIGVTSMFLASKYEDILPLRMEIMVKKIAHNRLSAEAIRSYECDILNTLNYYLQIPTSLEFLRRYMKEIDPYIKSDKELVGKMAIYLLKLCAHDYDFCGVKPSIIAISSIYVALKIGEQLTKHEMSNKEIIDQMVNLTEYSEPEIMECSQKILADAQNFDTLYPGLVNLKKTHFSKLMDYVPK